MTQHPNVTVTIFHTPAPRFWRFDRRWHSYYWIANEGKQTLVVSEFYESKEECMAAIWKLFGSNTDVWVKEGAHDVTPSVLRTAAR